VVLLVSEEMPDEKKPVSESKLPFHDKKRGKVKLQVYGEEMVEKLVSSNVNSGWVLPAPGLGGPPCQNHSVRLKKVLMKAGRPPYHCFGGKD
jgi:hypothetical protein